MRRALRTAWPLLALVSVGTLASPEDMAPAIKATASKTAVTVGERFEVRLEAAGPAGTTFSFPAEAGDANVELRTAAPGASPRSRCRTVCPTGARAASRRSRSL